MALDKGYQFAILLVILNSLTNQERESEKKRKKSFSPAEVNPFTCSICSPSYHFQFAGIRNREEK